MVAVSRDVLRSLRGPVVFCDHTFPSSHVSPLDGRSLFDRLSDPNQPSDARHTTLVQFHQAVDCEIGMVRKLSVRKGFH